MAWNVVSKGIFLLPPFRLCHEVNH
jgi:hypothetical protein